MPKKVYHGPLRKPRDEVVRDARALRSELRGVSAIQDAIEQTNAKRRDHFAKKEARYTLADGVSVFRERWGVLYREHFETYPPTPISPTRQVPRIKRSLIEPLRSANFKVSDFLNWLFENWTAIRYNYAFKKFRSYPEAPGIEFLLKYASIYLQVFHHVERGGALVEEEETPAKPPKEDRAALGKVIAAARRDQLTRDAEIARLKAENQRLRSEKKPSTTRRTAKPNQKPPEWD